MLTLRAILEGAPIRCEDMPRSFEVMARRLSTRLLFVSGFRSHLSRQGTPSRRLNTRLVLTPLAHTGRARAEGGGAVGRTGWLRARGPEGSCCCRVGLGLGLVSLLLQSRALRYGAVAQCAFGSGAAAYDGVQGPRSRARPNERHSRCVSALGIIRSLTPIIARRHRDRGGAGEAESRAHR